MADPTDSVKLKQSYADGWELGMYWGWIAEQEQFRDVDADLEDYDSGVTREMFLAARVRVYSKALSSAFQEAFSVPAHYVQPEDDFNEPT